MVESIAKMSAETTTKRCGYGSMPAAALFAALAMVVLSSLGEPSAADAAEGSPELSIQPRNTYLQPGERCTLQIWIDDAVDSISCMECRITFDSGTAECVTCIEGSLFIDSSFSTFFNWVSLAKNNPVMISTSCKCARGVQS